MFTGVTTGGGGPEPHDCVPPVATLELPVAVEGSVGDVGLLVSGRGQVRDHTAQYEIGLEVAGGDRRGGVRATRAERAGRAVVVLLREATVRAARPIRRERTCTSLQPDAIPKLAVAIPPATDNWTWVTAAGPVQFTLDPLEAPNAAAPAAPMPANIKPASPKPTPRPPKRTIRRRPLIVRAPSYVIFRTDQPSLSQAGDHGTRPDSRVLATGLFLPKRPGSSAVRARMRLAVCARLARGAKRRCGHVAKARAGDGPHVARRQLFAAVRARRQDVMVSPHASWTISTGGPSGAAHRSPHWRIAVTTCQRSRPFSVRQVVVASRVLLVRHALEHALRRRDARGAGSARSARSRAVTRTGRSASSRRTRRAGSGASTTRRPPRGTGRSSSSCPAKLFRCMAPA